MGRIKGKVAVVTGGARGLGKAICTEFVQEGARVILTDIDGELGPRVAEEIGATFFHHDVSAEEQWQVLFERERVVDILVNNAGLMGLNFGPADPEHASLENWRKVHTINLDSVFLGCKYGIQAMKERGGSIINMSSRSGMVGVPTAAAYASSKAAIRNHTKSVALWCASQNYSIRCNSIHPACIMTPLWESMLKDEGEKKTLEASIPLHRFGTPEEVAALALYLAADESAFVTGAEFTIDGGILAGTASSPKSH
jgi:NAD(P)-dependent dehydrogenase (short-subunit alcohol dehydrogenase family)